jgi:N utilization substance protein A
MSVDLLYALEQLEKEKGIGKELIIETIEAALISAYKKNFGSSQNVKVKFDVPTGEFKVYAMKKVAEKPQNSLLEISLDEAKNIDGNFSEEDFVEIEVTPRKFGRIAAQTAKQVVLQRLRDAEKGMIFDELVSKEGEIISGIVRRIERKHIVIEMEKAEAILPINEQVPNEIINMNDRIKVYVIEVKKSTKDPQIVVSRTHPGLVKRLFELEVPEINDGTVEIRSISREAGSRTKIAVFSRDENVDSVGSCVGQKGTRVQSIVDELKGEKIDIVKWSSNPEEYISSSLSPAKVVKVDIFESEKSARVVVPDFQLSLAIGKEGQNARLAAKLTGWKVDIKSQSQIMGQLFGEGNESFIAGREFVEERKKMFFEDDLFLNNNYTNSDYSPDEENNYYNDDNNNNNNEDDDKDNT